MCTRADAMPAPVDVARRASPSPHNIFCHNCMRPSASRSSAAIIHVHQYFSSHLCGRASAGVAVAVVIGGGLGCAWAQTGSDGGG